MNDALSGLTVTRAIPPEVITGLLTKQYQMYGGVIRWAPGTEYAGQIVRHLVPVDPQLAASSLSPSLYGPVSSRVLQAANTYQLHSLTAATGQILQAATGTMLLSGLNLAVTAVGFAVIKQKLKSLEGQLTQIQQEVRAIRELLELEERAKLRRALRNLLHATQSPNLEGRKQLLGDARNVLGPINEKYRELLPKADTIETAMGYEEYFSLTSLAHARCFAESGMLDIAKRNIEEDSQFWAEQARRIANDHLLGSNPERFLFGDFVEDAPTSQLIKWLDFAENTEKGYGWIDELRSKMDPWHKQSSSIGVSARKTFEELRNIKRKSSEGTKNNKRKPFKGIEDEKQRVIPALQKLAARDEVLQGYVAQYELLEENDITPSQFEEQIKQIEPELAVDGYLILQPKKHPEKT